jgi:hypothetical protein
MRLTPDRFAYVQRASSALTALYTVTGTLTDLAGTTITITTQDANSFYFAAWVADARLQTAGAAGDVTVQLNVDGVAIANPAADVNFSNLAAGARMTVGQNLSGVLAAAGAHTFKLQAVSAATGTRQLGAQHTTLTVLVFE